MDIRVGDILIDPMDGEKIEILEIEDTGIVRMKFISAPYRNICQYHQLSFILKYWTQLDEVSQVKRIIERYDGV